MTAKILFIAENIWRNGWLSVVAVVERRRGGGKQIKMVQSREGIFYHELLWLIQGPEKGPPDRRV